MKTKLLTLIIILMIMCSGCDMACDKLGWFCPDPINPPEYNITEDINNAQKTIEKSAATIDKSTDEIRKETIKIDKETTQVKDKIPQEIKPIIVPHLNVITESSQTIKDETIEINKATAKLTAANSLLENAEQKVITTEEALDTITKERDKAIIAQRKAEEARNSALHKAVRWLILASIVGAGALGVFGFMYNSKMCLTLAAVCIVVMSIAIFVETYFIYLVIGGGVILLGLVGVLAWNIIIQKRAFKEVVDTVEITKENLSLEKKEELFGKNGQTGIMDSIQSHSTIDIVKKEKSKMSSLWSYAKTNGDKK